MAAVCRVPHRVNCMVLCQHIKANQKCVVIFFYSDENRVRAPTLVLSTESPQLVVAISGKVDT